jgi:hypothetical protein
MRNRWLETILALTRPRESAGVEIILNMRQKIERMQQEVNEFMEYVKRELQRGLGDWEQRLNTALVPAAPTEPHRAPADADEKAERVASRLLKRHPELRTQNSELRTAESRAFRRF